MVRRILALLGDLEEVRQLEELQAHRFGPHVVINMTIGIDEMLTVKQGDAIATRVETLIYDAFPSVSRVHVHYHPAERQHENMTIDQILSEGRKHISPHQTEYSE